MPNPIIAEVTRGNIVESRHSGAWCVLDLAGRIVASAGDITRPIFPRSSVKAFQCVPLIEKGAADHFAFTDEEIALACASHMGEPAHVRVAQAMLAKAGLHAQDYECGAHWPLNMKAQHDVVRAGGQAEAVHNNCSGKHAGMLALARQIGAETAGYVQIDHPVQQQVAEAISRYCDVDVSQLEHGIDGCSVPTWAMPLRNMALGFARLTAADCVAGQRIIKAVRAHPFMIAGTGRFDTRLMQAVPRAFVKVGAEGVYCGCVPHAQFGIALKCDDGAIRGAEVAMASVLASLDVWTDDEKATLQSFASEDLKNWRKIHVGEVRSPL